MQEQRFDELAKQQQSILDSFRKQTDRESGLVELTEDLSVLKIFLTEAAEKVQSGGKSRCRSLAVTKIEEARMWLDEEMRTA